MVQYMYPMFAVVVLVFIQVTIAPIVPPLLLFLAKHPMVDNYKLSSLVDVICGGAPVVEELMMALKKRFPHIKQIRQGSKWSVFV